MCSGMDPSVIGGITLGYDFVNTGFGGYNYPDWMKYFGFATDFTYNRIDISQPNASVRDITLTGLHLGLGTVRVPLNTSLRRRLEGYMAAWTFLFMGHYGFFPDREVPFGTVAVLMWGWARPSCGQRHFQ